MRNGSGQGHSLPTLTCNSICIDPRATCTIHPGTYRSPIETGLYYIHNRYYDPQLCRWINADSLASTGQGFLGCNMFAYCGNNPVLLIDKNGMFPGDVEQLIMSTANAITSVTDIAANIASRIKASLCELNEEQKIFVATIAAEAGVAANGKPVSRIARQAMALVAMNRIHGKDWSTIDIIAAICRYTGFSGYGDHNYYACMAYLNNRDRSNDFYETIIADVMTVYNGDVEDFTGNSVLYFTPASRTPLGSLPPWNFGELEEVMIEGVDPYFEGRFFRYR